MPVASLRRKPDILSYDQAASVGVNYVAAWCGLETAGLKTGETVLLIGAAAQIAHRLGARDYSSKWISFVSRPSNRNSIKALPIDWTSALGYMRHFDNSSGSRSQLVDSLRGELSDLLIVGLDIPDIKVIVVSRRTQRLAELAARTIQRGANIDFGVRQLG